MNCEYHFCNYLGQNIYVAFTIDVFVRTYCWLACQPGIAYRFGTNALEQLIMRRQETDKLIHHSDHGSQYLSIRYTKFDRSPCSNFC